MAEDFQILEIIYSRIINTDGLLLSLRVRSIQPLPSKARVSERGCLMEMEMEPRIPLSRLTANHPLDLTYWNPCPERRTTMDDTEERKYAAFQLAWCDSMCLSHADQAVIGLVHERMKYSVYAPLNRPWSDHVQQDLVCGVYSHFPEKFIVGGKLVNPEHRLWMLMKTFSRRNRSGT